ncbi:MAG: HAMP domain-containing sensor histidine kinase [Chitinophagaceae bacterium]
MEIHTSFNTSDPPGRDPYFIADTTDNGQFALPETPETGKDTEVRFASILAHELRNPLTNINLAIELLDASIKTADLKVYMDIIRRSSLRISNLVKELLKYQEAEKVPAESHSMHQLLNEVLEMARDRILLKNISVSKSYAAQDYYIVVNRPKMQIALTNIIINAIDAMDVKNGRLKLGTGLTEGKYIIQIEDNGCGISQENLKNVFKPYFTDKPGGLGLGLAAANDIFGSNHVAVNIESEEGQGTRFTLMFEKDVSIRVPVNNK